MFFICKVYVGALSLHYEALSVEASKQTTADEIVTCIVERLGLTVSINCYFNISNVSVMYFNFLLRVIIMNWLKLLDNVKNDACRNMRNLCH